MMIREHGNTKRRGWKGNIIINIVLLQGAAMQSATNSIATESSLSALYQTVLDLQQRMLTQDNINNELSTRVDALECENTALNQQIDALEGDILHTLMVHVNLLI